MAQEKASTIPVATLYVPMASKVDDDPFSWFRFVDEPV